MNIINTLLASPRTVFTTQSLSMLSDSRDRQALRRSVMYYVKKGMILNPRKGIYTKPKYNPEEMACSILKPAYISLEYVLSRAGVTFQYSDEITCVSYQNRVIEVDGHVFSFRQINPMIWMNMEGLEQRDNIVMATPERAFLDMMYLSAGQCYFDNLRPLNRSLVRRILPTYNSPTLASRVEELFSKS